MPRSIVSGKIPVTFSALMIVILNLFSAYQGHAHVAGATLSGAVRRSDLLRFNNLDQLPE